MSAWVLREAVVGWQRRVLRGVLSLWLAVSLTFVLLRLLPGDAIEAGLLGTGASEETIAERQTRLGLNDTFAAQYAGLWAGLLRGDLGISLVSGLPVREIIEQNFGATFTLAIAAFNVALTLGVGFGVFNALIGHRFLRRLGHALTGLSLSLPVYWTGTIAIVVFSAQLNVLPSGGAGGWQALILPSAVLGFQLSGTIASVIEAGLVEAKRADFARTAYGKGLHPVRVLTRHLSIHAMLNAIPVLGLQFGFLMSGVVVTESLFARPGIGRALLNAVLIQDYPTVQGIVIWMASAYVLVNLAADLLIHLLDPRVRNA